MVKIISTEYLSNGSQRSTVNVFNKSITVNHFRGRNKIWIKNKALDKFNNSLTE